MSAAKNKNNKNKTARVMSLLTDREDEAKTADSARPAVPPPSLAPVDNDTAAMQIRSALEEVLQAEEKEALSQKEPVREEHRAAAAASAEESPGVSEAAAAESDVSPQEDDASLPASDQPPAPEGENPATAPAAETSLVPPAVTHPDPLENISYVNVMQALVEEKVDKYIRLFGLCTCPRCKIDVMALTLTNLPAKYVVVGENETIPMLTVYESRFNTMVISKVMWACKKVMDCPRHGI